MDITTIQNQFRGIGEVKGFEFIKIASVHGAYCYEVISNEGNIHYEVFKVKTVPVCIDFEKRIYSQTEFKEIYPKSKDFGVWAWTYSSKEKALAKLVTL
jgi:hypothetical protein